MGKFNPFFYLPKYIDPTRDTHSLFGSLETLTLDVCIGMRTHIMGVRLMVRGSLTSTLRPSYLT